LAEVVRYRAGVESAGKMMVIGGLAVVVVGGLVWPFGPKPGAGGGWLPEKNIPSDRNNFPFHFHHR
jgi:hypothetical protein